MRILYICDQSPFEFYNGSQQRNRLLLDALCMRGQVDLVCFTSDQYPLSLPNSECRIKYFEELPQVKQSKIAKRFAKLVNIFLSFSPYSVYGKNKVAYEVIQSLLRSNDYNYIVIRYLKNAFMCGLLKDRRIIVDIDDLPEQTILSYLDLNGLKRLRYIQYRFYAIRAKYHTNRFVKGIYHSFCSNKSQIAWVNSSHLPNIPFPYNNRNNKLVVQKHNFIVLFVGYMNHTPNLKGVQHFLDNIWGYVKDSVPDAVFNIAGKGVTPEQKKSWELFEGVHVLGFVPDLSSVYNSCKVVVVPVYSGAGSNIKVLEAMSFKRATVISEFAAVPYNEHLIENNDIMIAHNDRDFADKIINLLIDKQLNEDIAENGARVIAENYSHSSFLTSVHKYIF